MNNAERRLHEIEERLERLEAPEPPPELLASIQEEIPPHLGEGSAPAQPAAGWRWRRLAASLAVLAVGGLLGYKLFVDGPSPADSVGAEAPEAPPRGVVEPSEPGDPTRRTADPVVDPTVAEPAATVQPRRLDEPVARQKFPGGSSPAARPVRELGEDVAQSGAANGVSEQAAETVVVTSESPLLDRREVEVGEASPAPRSEPEPVRSDDVQASAQVGRENREIKRMRAEAEALDRELDRLQVSPPQARGVRKPMVADPTPGELPTRLYEPRRVPAVPIAPVPPSTGGTAEPNDEAYGDMFFQGYGTNPFVDTEDDAQSTFGIDVDTASYTLARSYLRRGSLPPADAIRVEEFVNYFDYGDPAPRSKDFAVVAEGAPSPFASTARTYLLRFALQGREVSAAQRLPAVLTFVVDVSGSMNRENRLGLVKRALRLLVDQLDAGDAVGLVVYGGNGRVILEPTGDHRRVLAAIDALQPGGSTNAEEGLVLGYRTARRHFRPGAINRVILCSDGVANVGRTGPESILARIAREAEEGIELTTVGFGMGNYNDVLMEQLADQGDGNYAYVDDLAAARRVFVENLTGTLQTIAADAKIQVEFDRQVVQSYRLLGYENRDIADRDFRNDAVDAGEIGGGHQVTALYEVKLRPDGPKRGRVATLRLRYHSKRSARVVEDSVELSLGDLAPRWNRASEGLRLAATAAEFAEILKGSHWARESDLGALAAQARQLSRRGRGRDEVVELTELIERAARLRGQAPADGDREVGDGIER